MTKRRTYIGVCQWDGCTNACRAKWCSEHREAAIKRSHQEAHKRRRNDPEWVASQQAKSRDYMRAKRSTWGPIDRELAHQQRRLSRYGVTVEWFNEQLKIQGGRCAICMEIPTGQRPWHVDHCHETGKVRGILCRGCNVALGNMRDNPAIMRAAADYIERHRQAQAA